MSNLTPATLADIDPRLLSEAFRRAQNRRGAETADAGALLAAIVEEARRGSRDLYSLVRAAENAGRTNAA